MTTKNHSAKALPSRARGNQQARTATAKSERPVAETAGTGGSFQSLRRHGMVNSWPLFIAKRGIA
jgi:hypothetical protein